MVAKSAHRLHHGFMFKKVLGGLVAAALAVGLIWQHRLIQQIRVELAGMSRLELRAAESSVASDATVAAAASDLNAARAEVQALQLRVVALEARVQALTLELERELKRQRELAAQNISAGPVAGGELKEHILNTKRGLKERFTAFRTLMRMGLVDAQTTAAFVDEVVALNNDELTADLFGALDNTGNLAAAPALIKGLQSDKVELRMRALDALSEMQSDATVVQWLQYAARNDAHDRVRAEAVRVLAQAGNQP